jgi:hypothetical protein
MNWAGPVNKVQTKIGLRKIFQFSYLPKLVNLLMDIYLLPRLDEPEAPIFAEFRYGDAE